MSLHDPHAQSPPPMHNELDSLEEVRETLAADVVEILSAVEEAPGETPTILPAEQVDSGLGDKQALLRAAIGDLEALDERLHQARQ
ncbi:MAG: hypothetical protein JWM61_2515 [Micrococcaceae bacterium]|jgi:hypothetical protein|uniref:Uncharacterized protein n=1 Tax=Arthrobacter cheniae TaxID=1258888 RepID=A0A3A5MCM8_9MICC|nr:MULTISPECIES: hypothetical protein [Arthrobacter]MCU1633863.1 hypothetical protein [Micrococcaceae bacterium]MEC5197796.1 hypothetical protein [Arthrobacter sp. PL16]RJT78477.1 hypothetical protein D6T63_13330 [Arthrobacter cheniae]